MHQRAHRSAQPLGVALRPRYLQGDFILAAMVAVGSGILGYWLTTLGIEPVFVILGVGGVIWLLLDLLLRRITKEHAAYDERTMARCVRVGKGERIVWPPLPTDPIVRGRPATDDDVKRGRAVFVMQDVTGNPGRAVDLELPQYGWIDDTPVAVIQAETDGTSTYLGLYDLISGSLDFSSIDEVQLLGTATPADTHVAAPNNSLERTRSE